MGHAEATPLPASAPSSPTWGSVFLGTFLGYLFAAALLFVAWLVLSLSGVVPESAVLRGERSWPYAPGGAWSAVANGTLVLGAVLVAGLLVRESVAARTRREISTSAVLAILLVTGFVPLAALPHARGGSWLFSWVATAALVKWFAVRPLFEAPPEPGRLASALRPVIVAGAAAAAGATLAYGLVHPLAAGWGDVADASGDPSSSGRPAVVSRNGPATVEYLFTLRNAGFAGVRVRDVQLDASSASPLVRLRDLRAEGIAPPSGFGVPEPALDAAIPGRESRYYTLVLGVCSRGTAGFTSVEALQARIVVLGTERIVPVRLDRPLEIRCGRGRL